MSFSLTRKTDYALVALVELAREKSSGGGLLSARQIAGKFHLPPHLLMNALKDLHRGGIICSRRGVSGGYALCREPVETTLLEVIEALEGPVRVTLCNEEPDNNHAACALVTMCPVSEPIRNFNHLLNDFLASITLETFVNQNPQLSTLQTGAGR